MKMFTGSVITSTNIPLPSSPDAYTEIWKKQWAVRDNPWHLSIRNPCLVKFEHKLMANTDKMTILFPFCGKVIDMKHYYLLGHQVFGVECSKDGIMDFFKEQELEYEEILMENGKDYCYATKDRRLCILNTNLYTLDDDMINGRIDSVWGRGAFGTIIEIEQDMYINTMKKLLTAEWSYLLLVTEFDQSQWDGVPYPQTEEKVRRVYDWCNVEKLFSWIPDHIELYQKHMGKPLEVREITYLLTAKNN